MYRVPVAAALSVAAILLSGALTLRADAPQSKGRAIATALVLTSMLPVPAARGQVLAGWSMIETEHFRFHFPPQPRVNPETFTAAEEQAFSRLRATFARPLPGKIDFYVWNTSDEAERLLGRPTGFARPDLLLIHATADQTPGHELTHVLVFHTIRPEQVTRFIQEGTAVAFDLSARDRLALARAAIQRGRVEGGSVLRLWQQSGTVPDDILYPVAGAFVEHLIGRGGRERFLELLRRQTPEHARAVYGDDFDRIVREFEASLVPARADGSPAQAGGGPSLDILRAQAQERMRQDRSTYSPDQLREIETMYQAGARNLRAPDSKENLLELVRKYPKSNRAGCSVLYLARMSNGAEKEQYLQRAIANHSDARFGDGAQVGAFARAELAVFYQSAGALEKARSLAAEVRTKYPGAVAHDGTRLEDALRRMKLLE